MNRKSNIYNKKCRQILNANKKVASTNYRLIKPIQHKRIFDAITKVANSIIKKKVSNIIIVDKSARAIYVGLKEYFKIKYPDIPFPKIYFLNPNMLRSEINSKNYNLYIEFFKKNYKHLLKDAKQPLLIVDNCLHTGKTKSVVTKLLSDVGFNKITSETLFKPEYIDSEKSAYFSYGCHTLGYESYNLIKDSLKPSLTSKLKTNLEERKKGIQIRKEIQQIVRDNIN